MLEKVTRNVIQRGFKDWLVNTKKFYKQRNDKNLLSRRDKNIWIFGAWEGEKYSDNSKYLYEYILNNEEYIKAYWVTRDKDIFNRLKKSSKPVLLIGTEECSNILSKAGVSFYTNGLDDFGEFPDNFGSYLVCLWHGIGIKNNYSTKLKRNVFFDELSNFKARIFSYIYRDLTIASSNYIAQLFKKESLTKNPIEVIGQPRNDIFSRCITAEQVFSSDFIDKYSIKATTKFILYMPTYRPSQSSQDLLNNLLIDIVKDKKLNELLNNNDIRFLMKLHYLTDASNIPFNENVVLLKDSQVSDPQQLLNISSLLISDYSTCVIDFALKKNDVILFTPDLEQYEKENGLYKEYIGLIKKYAVTSLSELTDAIGRSVKANYQSSSLTAEINNLYNDNTESIGHFCKDVTKAVMKRINMEK